MIFEPLKRCFTTEGPPRARGRPPVALDGQPENNLSNSIARKYFIFLFFHTKICVLKITQKDGRSLTTNNRDAMIITICELQRFSLIILGVIIEAATSEHAILRLCSALNDPRNCASASARRCAAGSPPAPRGHQERAAARPGSLPSRPESVRWMGTGI